MKYILRVYFRLILAIILIAFGFEILYPIISPLTFYASFYSLFFLNPILTSSTTFAIGNYSLKFIPACAAASAYLLLIVLIALVDLKLKKAVKVFLVGSLFIFIANLIRIDLLVYILIKYGSSLFDTLHLFFWRILASLYVVVLWIFLSKWFKIKDIPIYSDFKRILDIYGKGKK